VTVIGPQQMEDAIAEQAELLTRVGERQGTITATLEDYAANIGVDFRAVAHAIWGYLQADPSLDIGGQAYDDEALALLTGVAAKFLMLGVVLGRDHRP
jgi:hypothetical protein